MNRLISASLVRRPDCRSRRRSHAAVRTVESRRKRPLLIVGAGARTARLHVQDAAMRLWSRFGIPFVTTQMGKGVLGRGETRCSSATRRCPRAILCTAPSKRSGSDRQRRPRRRREAALLHGVGRGRSDPRQFLLSSGGRPGLFSSGRGRRATSPTASGKSTEKSDPARGPLGL